MKYIVSEEAVRALIRETMNPRVGWQSTTEPSGSPVSVSAVVDPSASMTDPANPNFKPSNRNELRAAISDMINGISDDHSEEIFNAMRDVIEKSQEDKDMKSDKKVEETIRLAIRKIIAEAKPSRKFKDVPVGPVTNPREITPTRYPAGVAGGEATRKFEKLKAGIHQSLDKTIKDAESAEMMRSDEPAVGRTRKNVMQTDVGGSSFKEIAEEMGYATESGAKQAVERILNKIKYRLTIPEDELDIIVLTTLKDTIDFLEDDDDDDDTVDSTFTPEEIEELKNNPEVIASWPEFREKLDKRLTRAQKRHEKLGGQQPNEPVEEAVDPKAARAKLLNSLDSTARVSDKVNKYIDYLKSSGELSDEEVEILKSRPDHVEELPGFKNFKG